MLAITRYAKDARQAALKRGDEPWRESAFAQQQAFYDDPSKRIAVLGTRRAGKTKGIAFRLCRAVTRYPRLLAPYITTTSGTSKDNVWSDINELNETHGLGLTPSLVQGRWYSKGGGSIWLVGCKDNREADKFRGKKYSEVIIDETGTFRTSVLEYLVDDVLDAALTDHDAPLVISGTAGAIPVGYFYDATDGEKAAIWSQHRWSVKDNPHHAFGQDPAALEAHRIKLGLEETDATWQREWCGRWCRDDNAVIYPYDRSRNEWDGFTFQKGRQRTILGIDFGYTSKTAFTVSTSVEGFADMYLRCSYGKTQLLPGQMAAEINRLRQKYQIHEIYGDGGGLGITIIKQLQQDYGVPIVPAEKQDKAGSIARVQQLLRSGLMHVDDRECAELIDEWYVLPWDEHHKGHHEDFADHNSDSALYSTRMHPLNDDWIHNPPKPGTPEWDAAWVAQQMGSVGQPNTRLRR